MCVTCMKTMKSSVWESREYQWESEFQKFKEKTTWEDTTAAADETQYSAQLLSRNAEYQDIQYHIHDV